MRYGLIPLVVSVLAVALVTLGPFVDPVNRGLTRAALAVFGRYARQQQTTGRTRRADERVTVLRAAHMGVTHRVYAAKTLLYATVLALAGSVIGVYLVAGVLAFLKVPEEQFRAVLPASLDSLSGFLAAPEFTPVQLFILLVASNVTIGASMGYAVYRYRWWIPRYRADARGRLIDTTLERTVAFVYALSNSGMTFSEVLDTLAKNKDVYGATAEEVEIAVRDMHLFGTDMMSALERVAFRSPSDKFADFSENLVSVLRSGRSLSRFLHEQYEQYKEESESQQQQFLDLLSTLAEAYVTVLVAGPLFLITILVIVGLVMGGTLQFLRVFVYLLLPLGTVGFVVYLDSLTTLNDLEPESRDLTPTFGEFDDVRHAEDAAAPRAATDGGSAPVSGGVLLGRAADGSRASYADDGTGRNRARLAAYNRLRWLRSRLRDPVGLAIRSPETVLYVTVPIAVLYLLGSLTAAALDGGVTVTHLDDVLVRSTLFVTGTFAVGYEIHRRRIRQVEASIPDFLDRLASANEAGMPILESIGQVARGSLGALDVELERLWADIQWGARVENALYRFEGRIGTAAATRTVALITNAMQASGQIGPVLRIAADQTQAALRLQRRRRQELLTYVIVIYLSFAVFVTIIIALTLIFLPTIPSMSDFGSQLPGGIGSGGGAQKAAYSLLFFHAALVQAVSSGLVAGQMGEGDVRGGAKHAALLLAVAYVLFLVLG